VRDTAYESLLRGRRHDIHTRILAALEDDPDIAPEVLAHHAEAAGQTERAIDLWEAAGKAANLRPAYAEAISHIERAIKINSGKDDAGEIPGLERALSLQLQLAPALLAFKGYAANETAYAYDVALSLANNIGETPLQFPAYYGLWVGKFMTGEHVRALEISQGVSEAAEKSGVSLYRMVAARLLGFSSCMLGRFSEAQKHLDQAISLYDPAENAGHESRFGQDPGAAIIIYQAINLWCLGKTRQSLAAEQQAEIAALATGHDLTIGYVRMHAGMRCLLANQGQIAANHIAELDRIGRKQDRKSVV